MTLSWVRCNFIQIQDKMKVFITGATGFIGKQVVNLLSNTDHELFCLVRKSSQRKIPGSKWINIIEGDLGNKNSIIQGMRGCDWVINLAGLYSYWEPDNQLFRKINVNGTRNVMEAALETRVSKVIHVSTVMIYGKQTDNLITEESKPGKRFTRYTQSKFEGDEIVWEMYKNKGLPIVVIYPSAVLGAGDPQVSGRYISDLIHRRLPITAFDKSVHSWVHVNDVAKAVVRAAEKPGNIGEKYFISNQRLSMREFNLLVSEISGVPLPKLEMPEFLAFPTAYFLTGISRVTKRRPLWGISVEQIRILKVGSRVDGTKAERDLGIFYMPIEEAIKEAIEADKG